MTRAKIAESVRAHILETCPQDRRNLAFTDTSSLSGTGLLDSVGVFSLVGFLEDRYGVEVLDEELGWNNFETIDGIARLVESKLAGPGPTVG